MDNQAVLIKLLILAVIALLITVWCMFRAYKETHSFRSKRFIALSVMFIIILILIYFL